jgi:very-short-patch-repair endonuclease
MATEHVIAKAQAIFDDHWASYAGEHPERLAEGNQNGIYELLEPWELRVAWDDIAANACKSPIEQILLAELMFMSTGYGPHPLDIWSHDYPNNLPPRGACIVAQYPLGRYTLDFGVFVQGFNNDMLMLAVECDGHNYHNKTKEQARHDRKRDRWLQKHGWQVVRFTGSEIHEDASACAEEVGDLICDFFEAGMKVKFPGDPLAMKFMQKRWDAIGFTPPYPHPLSFPQAVDARATSEKAA